ncbi:MAG TPA: hypothetical protein VMB34_32155 [Acetobacteraceae bacterium]|nr:hypothetical protein [Acetobacteraceae bacterium]
MAVIGIFTEPARRTRVLFDFQASTGDDEERIALAMIRSRGPLPDEEEGESVVETTEMRRARRVVPAFR